MKKRAGIIVCICFYLFLAAFSYNNVKANKYIAFEQTDVKTIEVTAKSLNVRSGPGTSYPLITQLKNGMLLTVLGSMENWYVVQLPDNSVGLVNSKYVRTASEQLAKEASIMNGAQKENNNKASEKEKMINLINQERQKNGLPLLELDDKISGVAQLKAEDMNNNNYFSHDSPVYGSPFNMLKQFGISYKSAGENIAGNKNIDNAHSALMKSLSHKANILDKRYKKVGIGIVDNKKYGKIIVQLFVE